MIIYGELLFFENMIIGGVLLYLTGEICGGLRNNKDNRKIIVRLRFLSGSIMCGLFSLVIFTGAKGAVVIFVEVLFAAAVCTVAFGKWRHAIVFILVTYFMGGITMGMLLLAQQNGIFTAAGIYTGDMKAALLALFILLGYMTIKQAIKIVKIRKIYTEHTYEAKIAICDHVIRTTAFLDTGNRLKDPMTGKPVAVASEKLWQDINTVLKAEETESDVRFALISYESVGAKGFLQAIKTDYIELAGRQIKGCLIAGSERDFALGKEAESCSSYDLLISAEMT